MGRLISVLLLSLYMVGVNASNMSEIMFTNLYYEIRDNGKRYEIYYNKVEKFYFIIYKNKIKKIKYDK
jgi:hypothetical protein